MGKNRSASKNETIVVYGAGLGAAFGAAAGAVFASIDIGFGNFYRCCSRSSYSHCFRQENYSVVRQSG